MKLNKEDWNQLDNLLSKMGFGGYYDVCECLKQSILDINKITKLFKEDKIQENNDLYMLIKILNRNSSKLKD
ncbi:MAG: hypothetical protein ACFFG0_51070 [Candidatus Thorarchaeota archaeon]